MTGTGLHVISKNTIPSYNTVVKGINTKQKENINTLERAIAKIIDANSKLNSSIGLLVTSITSLQKQVFLNQVLIDNWEKNPPYTFDYTILD